MDCRDSRGAQHDSIQGCEKLSIPRPVSSFRSRTRESSESEVSRLPLPDKPNRPRYSWTAAFCAAALRRNVCHCSELERGSLVPNREQWHTFAGTSTMKLAMSH